MKRRIKKGENCLNCGQELHDENFCPNCGQLNNIAKPTFGQLIMDALANLFAFDSKFYLSIWPLMRYPGRLSLEVVQGRKSTYLPPIRLFLLIAVIMLATSSIIQRCERGLGDVEHLRKDDSPMVSLNEEENEAVDEIANTVKDSIQARSTPRISFSDNEAGNHLGRIYSFVESHSDLSVAEGLDSLGLKHVFWNEFFYTSFLKLRLMSSDEYLRFWRSNLLIILLLFIPILALLLKTLYFYKKEYYYVDHFVFSLHTQAAFILFIILYLLLELLIGNVALLLPFALFPVYLLLALKNFYKQRWFYTLINFLVINWAFLTMSGIFLLLVGIVSFLLI
jgi:hypothetical protein